MGQVDPSGNIVNSIFTQSQARPPSFPLAGGQPGFQPLPAVPNPIETLLMSGKPMEQLSKIAQNFLTMQGGGSKVWFFIGEWNVL